MEKRNKVFKCVICGTEFKRCLSQIEIGATRTCSKACLSELFRGKRNPFWGKTHTDETKKKYPNPEKENATGNIKQSWFTSILRLPDRRFLKHPRNFERASRKDARKPSSRS